MNLAFTPVMNTNINALAFKSQGIENKHDIHYSEDKKPNWNDVLNEVTKGYARKTTENYKAFDERTLMSTRTKYFNLDGEVIATVYNVRSRKLNHNTIHTPDADYMDMNMDGKIDLKRCR